MPQNLMLSGVTYAYPCSPEPILDNVTVTFPPGWTALMGDNGCGKTTLAKIACALLEPGAGSVTHGLVCAYVAQDADEPPEALSDFALDYGRDARRLRDAFRLTDDMPWRFSELSFGERKKLQVAVALWRRPDVLVADEPTNHLDADARAELAAALADFGGIGILVSHDRDLVDALATRCVSFEPKGLVVRPGGYTAAHAQAELERAGVADERRNARRELARLSAEKDARAHEAARADVLRSKGRVDPKDHDAKFRINRARFTGKDGHAGRVSAQMDAHLAAARERLDAARTHKRYDGDLWLGAEPARRRTVLHVPATTIPCGPDATLQVPELWVGNTDHVGVVGPNGAGKSTLLAHLRVLLAQGAAGLGVLDIPQELAVGERDAAVRRIASLGPTERGRVLSAVAQLNSEPDRVLEGGRTSPGELRKLLLAEGALRRPALILMDEPTNHLDLHSTEALERALTAWPGALVLVSHDRRFLSACTTRTWEVRDGRVREA
ncbi:ATP-binding cassette domain-containing protein [Olsenella profusa]|uniref:ABC-F family ATP-binding cassette domain-containing protein n=1 Tax=Olsenella profusa TaxID=138595 RepID=A0ABS2EZN7_9ACTN|nr:ATP-binding cassette domain-containing protein [Olsenella profusa]MBM6774181.1 ABC-F family ATP-binding cassette domain-containing protein [Olsenella profusa]